MKKFKFVGRVLFVIVLMLSLVFVDSFQMIQFINAEFIDESSNTVQVEDIGDTSGIDSKSDIVYQTYDEDKEQNEKKENENTALSNTREDIDDGNSLKQDISSNTESKKSVVRTQKATAQYCIVYFYTSDYGSSGNSYRTAMMVAGSKFGEFRTKFENYSGVSNSNKNRIWVNKDGRIVNDDDIVTENLDVWFAPKVDIKFYDDKTPANYISCGGVFTTGVAYNEYFSGSNALLGKDNFGRPLSYVLDQLEDYGYKYTYYQNKSKTFYTRAQWKTADGTLVDEDYIISGNTNFYMVGGYTVTFYKNNPATSTDPNNKLAQINNVASCEQLSDVIYCLEQEYPEYANYVWNADTKTLIHGNMDVYVTPAASVTNTQNNDIKYYSSLEEAIAAVPDGAQADNYIVKMLADSLDNSIIKINKSLTLNLNGHSIKGGVPDDDIHYNSALQVLENGHVILEGEGSITTALDNELNHAYAAFAYGITNKGYLKINGNIQVKKINYEKGDLVLNATLPLNNILLGQDCIIKAGEKLSITENQLSLTLGNYVDIANGTDNRLSNLYNAVPNSTVVLIQPDEGVTLDENLITKLTLDISPIKDLTPNEQVVIKTDKEGNAVAYRLKNVYVDPINGDDNNFEKVSAKKPVKTYEGIQRALECLKNNNSGVSCIYIMNELELSDDDIKEFGELPRNIILHRYYHYDGYLLKVKDQLTLKNITIDGFGMDDDDEKYAVNAKSAMIDVPEGTVLNIKENAILKNNNHIEHGNYSESGGAIFSKGTVVMSGGEITGNSGFYGGGIEMYGPNAKLIMSDGIISNNIAKKLNNDSESDMPCGGGIALIYGANMELSGGTIDSNMSEYFAGGISVGSSVEGSNVNGTILNMTGGTISNNGNAMTDMTTKISPTKDGGGIFIQCGAEANISGGTISGNKCGSGGMFGGGGIYVNGGKADFADGILRLTNVVIKNNSASSIGNGGGLAACGTSHTRIYLKNSGAIYNNTAGDGNQIYVSSLPIGTSDGETHPPVNISEYMLGGYIYHWTENGKSVSHDRIHTDSLTSDLFLDNDCTLEARRAAEDNAKVWIINNSSGSNGGGIGCNGIVEIGQNDDVINIPVIKKWDDSNNENNIRPNTIKIWLMRKTQENDEFEKVTFLTFNNQIDNQNGETLSFTNQPKTDSNGNDYIYIVKEEISLKEDEIESPYMSKISGSIETGFTITNIETINIPVKKEWSDKNNQDGMRPSEITVQLKANGEVIKELQLKDSQNWEATFNNLPKYENGKEIAYTVEEMQVSGYSSQVTGNIKDGYIIRNTLETVNVEGKKTWVDHDNNEMTRPKSIIVKLFANGDMIDSQTVKEKDNWTYHFNDLNKYDKNGQMITYTVEEEELANYYATKGVGEYDIVNTLKTVTVELTAKKALVGRKLTDKDVFNFVVLEGDKVVAKGTNNKAGDITFDTITYHKAGEHNYIIKEVKGNEGENGIYYSQQSFEVKVLVTDNKDGTLSTEVLSEDIVITNSYKAEKTSVVLEATKTIDGKKLQANEFKFEVYENGQVVATGSNDAKGIIQFTPIEYTAVGNHRYIIKEVNGGKSMGRIIYDGTEYNVTVSVVDNGKGQLEAIVKYPENKVQFENTYIQLASLVIYKVDQDGHLLSGATFKLKKVVEGKEEFIDEQKGGPKFEFKELKDGKYRIYETACPKGYKKLDTYFEVEIIEGEVYYNGELCLALNITNTNDETKPHVSINKEDKDDEKNNVQEEEKNIESKDVKTSDNQNILEYMGLSLLSASLLFFLKKKKVS